MAKFDKKVPQVGFVPSNVKAVPVDTSTAQAIQGFGGAIVQAGVTVKNENDAAAIRAKSVQDAADAQQEIDQTNQFEDNMFAIIDQGQQPGFTGKPDDVGGGVATEDQDIVRKAQGSASVLRRKQASGANPDAIDLALTAEFRKFKRAAPHLAPKFREFFKNNVGKSAIQTALDVQESAANAAQEAQTADNNFWLKKAQLNNFYDPRDTPAVRRNKGMQIQARQFELQEATRQADLLKQDTSLSKGQRKAAEGDIMLQGFDGYYIGAHEDAQGVLQNAPGGVFNPETATPPERTSIIQSLQIRKGAMEADLRNTFPETSASPDFIARLALLNKTYDNAINYAKGKDIKEFYDTSVAIRVKTAELKLLNVPGVADKQALMNQFKGLDLNQLVAEDRLAIGTRVIVPLTKALLLTVATPDLDPYQELSGLGGPKEQAVVYKQIQGLLSKNLEDPKVATTAANVATAWTNIFNSSPTKVPVEVYDVMLKLGADKNIGKLYKINENLRTNMASGLRVYGETVIRSMGEDLAKDMNTSVKISEASRKISSKANDVIGLMLQRSTGKNPNADPKIFEAIVPRVSTEDGSVVWAPIPELANDRATIDAARTMTGKYGRRLGEVSRIYAHTVAGDTNYVGAYKKLLSGENFAALGTVESAGFNAERLGREREKLVLPPVPQAPQSKLQKLEPGLYQDENGKPFRVTTDGKVEEL